jgi:hypothetical protein
MTPLEPLEKSKNDFNARAKSSMRDLLRSKSWVEKVKSIERMNLADKTSKSAMRERLHERSLKVGDSAMEGVTGTFTRSA